MKDLIDKDLTCERSTPQHFHVKRSLNLDRTRIYSWTFFGPIPTLPTHGATESPGLVTLNPIPLKG